MLNFRQSVSSLDSRCSAKAEEQMCNIVRKCEKESRQTVQQPVDMQSASSDSKQHSAQTRFCNASDVRRCVLKRKSWKASARLPWAAARALISVEGGLDIISFALDAIWVLLCIPRCLLDLEVANLFRGGGKDPPLCQSFSAARHFALPLGISWH